MQTLYEMSKESKENKLYYFSKAEEEAFVRYLQAEDANEKNNIFNDHLHAAFIKMIESIIRRYKLFVPDEEFKDTFDDTISFLMSKVDHFKPEKNKKAYSYCGTICKNYLIWKVKQYYKNLERNESFDTSMGNFINSSKYSYDVDRDKREFLNGLFSEITGTIQTMTNNPSAYKLKDNDVKVGKALLTLFEEWDELFARMGTDKFNRSSIILFIQESTCLTATEVKTSLLKFKVIYKKIKSSVSNIYYN